MVQLNGGCVTTVAGGGGAALFNRLPLEQTLVLVVARTKIAPRPAEQGPDDSGGGTSITRMKHRPTLTCRALLGRTQC